MSCYAAHLGDCAGGRTKEHYVSESVLKLAGDTLQVAGFPWQHAGETAQLSPASLTARILCAHHNHQLSPLDAVAKEFVTALKCSFQEASEARLSDKTCQISGTAFELWLLKVLCGMLRLYKITIPTDWIDILFQRKPWPDGMGMHMLTAEGDAAWYFTLVRVTIVKATNDPTRITGAQFGIGGLAMLLALGTPRFTDTDVRAVFRPGCILIEAEGKTQEHVLSWEDNTQHPLVSLEIEGKVDRSSSAVRAIVEPHRPSRA